MQDRKQGAELAPPVPGPEDRPLLVVGITHAQTCMVLPARLRALKSAGFRVVLISSPGDLLDSIACEEQIEVLPIPIRRGISPLADVVSLLRLCRTLRRVRPVLTEFSTPKAGLLGNLAARLCGVPMRVYMLRGLRLETLAGPRHWLVRFAERIASACAHRVVCNSESLRDKVLELRIAPARKLHVLGSGSSQGVDLSRFSPGHDTLRAFLRISPRTPVIGFVGRLTRDKGIPELITAFDQILQAVPAARLLLVGWFDQSDDALDALLRQRIENHPAIVCTGYVPDTTRWYRAMDMLVLPTWREGFPNVVLEAAATGLPVITTIATGSRDAVLPEVTGLLIPVGYPQAIVEAVLRLVRNPEEAARMGRAGRAWVLERFLSHEVLGRTVDYYRKLIECVARNDAPAFATDAAVVGD